MSVARSTHCAGLLLLFGLAALFPSGLLLDCLLFSHPVPSRWAVSLVGVGPAAPTVPKLPAIYRRLPADTRTVLTIRPRALFDSPLAHKHGLDRMRDKLWTGFRLGDLDTVVIALPDQADLERAFIIVEGQFNPVELRQRLRAQNPSAGSYTEGAVEVLELNAPSERYAGLTVSGNWRVAVLDDRMCLVCLGDRQTLMEGLNPKKPLAPDLIAALAERPASEHLALVMLPPFLKTMRKKMDLNPLLQAFPDLSDETYNPPSDMEVSLAGCLRISAWLKAANRVDGELRSLSERQADAEKFQKNLEYSLNLLRKASRIHLEGSPGLAGMLGEIDGFYRSLEVVRDGKQTILRRKSASGQ